MSQTEVTGSGTRKRKRTGSIDLNGKVKKESGDKNDDLLSHAPESVKIVDLVENRATEIIALTNHVDKIGGTKLVSQRLPRHMRRRALSHNIQRLPRRLREVAAKEIERTSSTKKPSRKHRRRPKNLMSEYQRRQRRVSWLETHIWHAKRFHMVEKWGYRLPDHPNDKSMRACHRAADKYCLLQDVSYEGCIEITGQEEKIRLCLSHLVSDQTGPTLLGKQYVKGSKWGETVMFGLDQYPHHAIGRVSFLWRPPQSEDNTERQLWLWCHTASFESIWQELVQSVGLEFDVSSKSEQTSSQKDKEETDEKSENTAPTCEKPDLRDLHFDAGGIRLKSLKDGLCKFRLTGQTSHAIVAEVLQASDVSVTDKTGSLWWQKFYTGEDNQKNCAEQKQVSDWLKKYQSATEVPPSQVVVLTVRDPRLLLPPKKIKVMPKMEVGQAQSTLTDAVLVKTSPLWDEAVRQEVKSSKMADHELNKRRGENLVPGMPVDLGLDESRIPVLLLQRPGYRTTISASRQQQPKSVHQGFGCGWDVIVPQGWGTAFHIAFVFRGARVGGLREASAVSREAGTLQFPADFPDTEAGRVYAAEQKDQLKKKYDRNPPAKRPNYVKMGVQNPFLCPWLQLVDEWQSTEASQSPSGRIFVLRNLRMLKLLNEVMRMQQKDDGANLSKLDAFPRKAELEEFALSNARCLIPLRITMHGKGVPLKFAHICIPKAEDFECLNKDSDSEGPCEPKHPDPEGVRRKKAKKQKKKSKKTTATDLKSALAKPSNPMEAALAEMLAYGDESKSNKPEKENKDFSPIKELPNASSSVEKMINSTKRQIIGFVNDGDFSLGQGQGHGKAFCSLLGLVKLMSDVPAGAPCLALVRNTTSLQYRFVWLSVII
ncbi:ribonucleases P/MRP protein subunit POP1-like [Haliotis rubra]|uniref:ribonucleases P/MRP protein subunit POP1-like n=1 Tax=Haliotis rubra TaxID=36100 RepID=UPI001EE52344|nr:ribonucleases P/MRP protein subunit POP1-like [Haliotis rubra]XP_046582343.1 ribonucleases P/MRP protein subunit POP1-like [Haliotis rubra]XP_046582344.1 ribonucleases P/MRP protein subunit POP1-like [Haliotis rubra]